MLKQIICSGQAGSERAALDAAIVCNFDHGGFCMRGRLAEDGHIPQHYQLISNEQDNISCTQANVEFSDATAIFYCASLLSEQEHSLLHCLNQQRPYKLLDLETLTPAQAAGCLEGFVQAHNIERLNITGPATSTTPTAYDFTYQVVRQLLYSCLPLPTAGQTAFTRQWNQNG